MNQHALLCRLLSALLRYPDAELRAAHDEFARALDASVCELTPATHAGLARLIDRLAVIDPWELEADYVATFDRGRKTSLHLFEHVHGDSRDRGPAMIDLHRSYEAAGYAFTGDELPDWLPAVLEFASTQPREIAAGFLGETAHILEAIHAALAGRRSPYAPVLAAAARLAGIEPKLVETEPEPPLDASWAEPEVFGGCSSAGQQRPGQLQPVHFVRTPSGEARRAA